jgi:hypothetical protein
MTIELVSIATGGVLQLSAKAFGRLLHLAKQNGWEPEKGPKDWPEANWDTQVFLPYLGRYLPGLISATEAQSLRRALIRASATGQVAIDGNLTLATEVLLQAAREGPFQVRCTTDEPRVHARNAASALNSHSPRFS